MLALARSVKTIPPITSNSEVVTTSAIFNLLDHFIPMSFDNAGATSTTCTVFSFGVLGIVKYAT
jgi:hypothetical protein